MIFHSIVDATKQFWCSVKLMHQYPYQRFDKIQNIDTLFQEHRVNPSISINAYTEELMYIFVVSWHIYSIQSHKIKLSITSEGGFTFPSVFLRIWEVGNCKRINLVFQAKSDTATLKGKSIENGAFDASFFCL